MDFPFSKYYDLTVLDVPTVARFKYFSKSYTLRFKNYGDNPFLGEIVYGVFDEILLMVNQWINNDDLVQLTIKQIQPDSFVKVCLSPRPFSTLNIYDIISQIEESEGIYINEDINLHFFVIKKEPRKCPP